MEPVQPKPNPALAEPERRGPGPVKPLAAPLLTRDSTAVAVTFWRHRAVAWQIRALELESERLSLFSQRRELRLLRRELHITRLLLALFALLFTTVASIDFYRASLPRPLPVSFHAANPEPPALNRQSQISNQQFQP